MNAIVPPKLYTEVNHVPSAGLDPNDTAISLCIVLKNGTGKKEIPYDAART